MKKVLIGIMLLSLLVGCGGIKKYSQHEKDDLIIEVYDFGDEVAKGNKEAAEELEAWKVLTPEFRAKQINKEIGHEIGKW